MATAKQAHAMVSYFVKKYQEKYTFKPTLNRYAARWGMESILEDMTDTEGKELVDYYFTTASPNGHSLEWFFYNYDKLSIAMEAAKNDRAALALIHEETKRRTEAWREKNGIK